MPANWTEFASVHFYNSSVLEYPRLSTRIEHNACTYQAVKSGSAAASHKPCVRRRRGARHLKIGSHEDELWPNLGQWMTA